MVLAGFLLNCISSYNVAYNLGKPGDKSKLKQLLVTLGAPLFTVLFLYCYLNGVQIFFGAKILIEIAIIIAAYVEVHEIEKSHKEAVEI